MLIQIDNASAATRMAKLAALLAGVLVALGLVAGATACSPAQGPSQESSASRADATCSVVLLGSYPHDTGAFTEGLFWHEGVLCESTGIAGESLFRKGVSLETGAAAQEVSFPNGDFGEGSSVLDGVLYLLTYHEGVVYRYDYATLKLIDQVEYPREGWGLATDGKVLYASDGSSTIFILDKDLHEVGRIAVAEDGAPVSNLNELEYIDGLLWANVWQTDDVVIIDPESGIVVQRLNFASLPLNLFSADELETADCMNGLAWNPDTQSLFMTGKYWPLMFEFQIEWDG